MLKDGRLNHFTWVVGKQIDFPTNFFISHRDANETRKTDAFFHWILVTHIRKNDRNGSSYVRSTKSFERSNLENFFKQTLKIYLGMTKLLEILHWKESNYFLTILRYHLQCWLDRKPNFVFHSISMHGSRHLVDWSYH